MQARPHRSQPCTRALRFGAGIAAEVVGGYDTDGVATDDGDATTRLDARSSDLDAAIEAMFDLDLTELHAGGLGDLLCFASQAKDRLDALLLTVVNEQRQRARQARSNPDDAHNDTERDRRARDHGDRELRDTMRNRCRLGPGEAKRAERTAQELEETADAVTRALRAGHIRVDHARVITETADKLAEGPDRDGLIDELLDAARRLDPVALARLARRRLGELDPDAAATAAQRDESDRRLNVHQTTRGSVRLSGELFGLAAESLLTGLRAFSRPDGPDQYRTGPQRQADALEAAITAGLDRGTAPTEHGQRPHLLVLVPWEALRDGSGTAELAHLGPYPWKQLRCMLDDAIISRVVFDSRGTPLEVSNATRTVPAGLYRALLARDRGCRWPGCDAPAGYCDVAHGPIPYRNAGRLGPDNAALLCRRHHRRFDLEGWHITIHGDQVDFAPPTGPNSTTQTTSGRPAAPHGATPDASSGAQPGAPPGTRPDQPPGKRPAARSGTPPRAAPDQRSGTRPAARSGTPPEARSGTPLRAAPDQRPSTPSGARSRSPSGERSDGPMWVQPAWLSPSSTTPQRD